MATKKAEWLLPKQRDQVQRSEILSVFGVPGAGGALRIFIKHLRIKLIRRHCLKQLGNAVLGSSLDQDSIRFGSDVGATNLTVCRMSRERKGKGGGSYFFLDFFWLFSSFPNSSSCCSCKQSSPLVIVANYISHPVIFTSYNCFWLLAAVGLFAHSQPLTCPIQLYSRLCQSQPHLLKRPVKVTSILPLLQIIKATRIPI